MTIRIQIISTTFYDLSCSYQKSKKCFRIGFFKSSLGIFLVIVLFFFSAIKRLIFISVTTHVIKIIVQAIQLFRHGITKLFQYRSLQRLKQPLSGYSSFQGFINLVFIHPHQTDIVPFPCHVSCKTHKLSVSNVHFPVLIATSIVSVLQSLLFTHMYQTGIVPFSLSCVFSVCTFPRSCVQ